MANRYWVGGSGNWEDAANHWSTTSGGSPGSYTLGSENILNGSFTGNANNWTVGGTASYSSNHISFTGAGGGGNIQQTQSFTVVDSYYLVSVDITYTSGTLEFDGGFYGGQVVVPSSTGTHTFVVKCASDNQTIYFGSADFAGTIDNVSIKEITNYTSVYVASGDDVIFDSNSGLSGGTINTPFFDFHCHNLTVSGTASFDIVGDSNMSLSGSIVGATGCDLHRIDLTSTSSETITSNGCTFYNLNLYGVAGLWTLQDNLTVTNSLYHENGELDANNHNLFLNDYYVYVDIGYSPTITMGSGIWEITGTNGGFEIDNYSGEYATVNLNTSTIKFTGGDCYLIYYDDSAATSSFTFYNVWNATTSSLRIYNTYGSVPEPEFPDTIVVNQYKIDPGCTTKFDGGLTFTVTDFDAVGTSGNEIVITTNTPFYGPIGDITLLNGGQHYEVGDVLTFQGGGSGATLEVTSVSSQTLGTEKVTNGLFTGNASSWTLSASCVYSSNNVYSDGTNFGYCRQTFAVNTNTLYKIKFTLSGGNSGTMRIYFNNSYFNAYNQPMPDGDYIYYVTTGGSNTGQGINFSFQDSTPYAGYLDNISVQEVIVDGGAITGYTVLTQGDGYYLSTYSLTGGYGSGASFSVDTIDALLTAHYLVKSGGGVIDCDYMNIQHSIATPSSTWYAGTHSTNNQSVAEAGSGWIFTASGGGGPPPDTASFLAFLM